MRNIRLKRKLLLFFWPMLLCATVYGQSAAITGQVLDPDGQPLLGASVAIKGQNTGTITAADGSFSIVASPADVLSIAYVGYKDLEVGVNGLSSPAVFRMQEEAGALEEVVVVGYGVQKKVSSVASISTAKGEELLKGGSMNSVSEALQGRINGVIAINSNAKPGANTASIYIRGKSTWNNTDPLILVDGIERNFNDVDMTEVESISVLKDASATAVYGVRGGNGVILLTTRRGSGKTPKVNFNSSFGFKKTTAKVEWPDYITSATVYNEAVANDQAWASLIPESTFEAWRNAYATGNYGPYNEMFPQVDWWDAVMKDYGTTQQYNVTVDGSGDKMSYFVSVGYHRDGDIYNIQKQPDYDPRSIFQRYNWRSNLDFKLTGSTTFSVNIAGNIGYRGEKIAGDGETYTRIIQAPVNVFPVKYENGYWGDTEAGGYNILANMYDQGENSFKTSQNWYDFALKQNLDMLTKGLSVTAKASYNSYVTTRSTIRKGKILGQNDYNAGLGVIRYHKSFNYSLPTQNPDGTITYPIITEKRLPDAAQMEDMPAGTEYDNLNNIGDAQFYEFQVNYANSFADHNVTALALVNRSVRKVKDPNRAVMAFPNYREDWVGRLTYNFREKYLAEFNMSYTGSEKFAPGRRFGLFPSYSVGWRLSEEPFIKKMTGKTLDNLKVRYSYGKVGSDFTDGRFLYIQTYEQANGVLYGDGNGVNTGYRYTEGNVANPYAGWEVAYKQNLGVEASLFDSRLRMEVDLFDEKRENILMGPRQIIFWMGVNPNNANLGKTKSHGIDVDLKWNDKIGSNWDYNIGLLFSSSENRIVYRDDPADMADYQKDAGKPIGWQSRYISLGNFSSIDDVYNYAQTALTAPGRIIPGDLVYVDYNGDGVINVNDKVISDKLNYPLTTYTLNLGLSYKSLSFSAMLYAPLGQYRVEWGALYHDFPEGAVKAQPAAVDRWTWNSINYSGVRRPATHMREGRAHNDVDNSLRYVDNSYLRLKTVELRYDLSKKILGRSGISSLTLYANGNNLLTFSNVDSRIDPETGSVDAYPIVKTYTVGIRMGF